MFGLLVFRRSIHITSRVSMSTSKTSMLSKLRKSTGYPLTNCKKAVELFPDDFTKAEEWLHAEAKSKGWSKWAKIQTRTATQGLIGVCSKDNVGAMIEINCETDFVSRNADFQQIVEEMLSGCIKYAENLKLESDITKTALDESQLNNIPCKISNVGELAVAATMKFNEKTVAKRAVLLKVPEDVLLNSLTHPAVQCPNLSGGNLGRYGVLLVSKVDEADKVNETSDLRQNLCHHIIGMNPVTIGELTEKDIAKFSEKKSEEPEVSENVQCEQNIDSVQNERNVEGAQNQQNAEGVQSEQNEQSTNVDTEDSQAEDQETIGSQLKESNETELVFQSYLMDPTMTVGETLYKSKVKVIAFERFECGETATAEAADVAVAASG